MADDPDELLTSKQAAALVGRTVSTVNYWAARDLLAVAGRGANRAALFRRAEVLALAARLDAKPGMDKIRAPHHEPTEAELDAMIAEGMKSLPEWWAEDEEAMRANPPDPREAMRTLERVRRRGDKRLRRGER